MPEDRPDRLPPLPADRLTAAQREALDELAAGPRGSAVGPFPVLLRSPLLMTRLQKVGEYLRFSSPLDRRLFEMMILVVARHWDQQFEWSFHQPLALEAGLDEAVADAIAAGRRPERMDEGESVVWDLLAELHRDRDVSDATYERAVRALGEEGVVELVGAAGYYTTLAMVMNTGRTAAPAAPRLPDRTPAAASPGSPA